jgi:heme-degrading monooxygenase HmoA
MIVRQWQGLAKPERAEDYVAHLRTDTFPQLATIPGFIDASILRRDIARGVEFLVVTRWDSIEAIRQFAGPEPEHAVVPRRVQDMMVEYDRSVRHYEVVATGT